MPRIPTYQSDVQERVAPSVGLQTGSPAPSNFGTSSLKADQFMSGLIERVGRAGQGATNRAIAEQDKYDNALARQKEMETLDWARDTYRAETDTYKLGSAKDDGEGKSVYDRMDNHFRDYYKEKTKGLTKKQLEYYQPAYDRARQSYMSKSDAYVAQQVEAFNRTEKSSQINHRENFAIENRDDQEEIANVQLENEADIRSLYKGASSAFIQEKIQNSNDRIHNGVIASFLRDGQTVEAWRYFKQNSEEMSEKIKDASQTALESAALKDHAENYANILELDYEYPEALEKAKGLTNAHVSDEDLRESVGKILRSREAQRKQIERQVADQNFNSAIDFILDVEGPTREAKYNASEKFINENFSGKDRLNLLSKAKTLHRGTGSSVTNLELYQKLSRLQQGNKDKFLKTNIIRDYGHQLSDGDAKSFIKTQEAMRADREAFSIDSRITLSAKEIGAEVNNKRPLTAEKFREYKDAIDTRVKELKQSTGKDPGIEEINTIIQDEQIKFKLREVESGELKGDSRRHGFSFGYGPDVDVEKALKDPLGLPDINDDKLVEELTEVLEKDGNYIVNDTTLRILARIKMGGAYSDELKELANQYRK